MKQVQVTILGQGYILGCPEGGESLLQAAVGTVDREMSAIRDGGKVKARERIAVLAALNLAYQLAERAPVAAPSAAAAAAALPAAGASGEDGIDLDGLIHRLDAAIGNDGHLL